MCSHYHGALTTDFAKEGLFNLLNNRIDFEGIDVLICLPEREASALSLCRVRRGVLSAWNKATSTRRLYARSFVSLTSVISL